jgi:hypothetical protein
MPLRRRSFLVWCPDDGASGDDASSVDAYDAEDAADVFGERRYYEADYPAAQQIHVADDGVVRRFTVTAERDVRFYVREAK